MDFYELTVASFDPYTVQTLTRLLEASCQIDFMAEGYCFKCKAKKEIAEAVEETMKNGRKAIKGKCPTCGVVMFKILGGSKATAAAAATTPTPAGTPKPTNQPS
jgi:Zn finger protein HypA/HybF involved in hydrogenase expression